MARKILASGWQWIILFPMALFFLSGCAVIAGDAVLKGRDEAAAMVAAEKLKKEYCWVNFQQVFPETYLFKKSKKQVWKEIVQVLKMHGEKIYKLDEKKGKILTETTELPLGDDSYFSKLGVKKISYEMDITVEAQGTTKSYVTNYITVQKVDKYDLPVGNIFLPTSGNIIRGVFFASLAANFYPERKRKAIRIAKSMGISSILDRNIVHIVEPGETLGGIAAKYTGNLMNYREIAEYNNINDPKKITQGQGIIIPSTLLK